MMGRLAGCRRSTVSSTLGTIAIFFVAIGLYRYWRGRTAN
jgi:hypothetical protein